jgi:hypothetical protein
LTNSGFDEARTDVLAHRFTDGRIYLDLHGSGKSAPLDVHDALGRILKKLGRAPQGIPSDTEQRGCLRRSPFHRAEAVRAPGTTPRPPSRSRRCRRRTAHVTVIISRDALTELRGGRLTTVDPLTPMRRSRCCASSRRADGRTG